LRARRHPRARIRRRPMRTSPSGARSCALPRRVLRCVSPAIPNAIAALLLYCRDETGVIPPPTSAGPKAIPSSTFSRSWPWAKAAPRRSRARCCAESNGTRAGGAHSPRLTSVPATFCSVLPLVDDPPAWGAREILVIIGNLVQFSALYDVRACAKMAAHHVSRYCPPCGESEYCQHGRLQ